jgi:hypothetical protein
LLFAVVLGTAVVLNNSWRIAAGHRFFPLTFASSVKLHLAVLAVVAAMTWQGSNGLMGTDAGIAIARFCADPTIAREAGEKLQSYYEDLNTTTIQAGPLLSSLTPTETNRRAQAEGFLKVSRQADMYQGIDLIPGVETELDGSRFSVNRLGMRDRKTVTFDKPDGVTRIVLIGSSIVMGYGVSDDDVFARKFENQLNDEFASAGRRFEVLNFGVGKQWAAHRMIRIQRQVFGFDPNAVYYFAHQDEFNELASHLAQLVANRRGIPSPHLKEVAQKAMVTSDLPPGEIYSRLSRIEPEILLAIYRTIVDDCRRHSAQPVWVYLPIPASDANQVRDKLIPIASEARFTVLDLSGWDQDRQGLFPTSEYHPNGEGHRLIAEALVQAVKRIPQALLGIRSDD